MYIIDNIEYFTKEITLYCNNVFESVITCQKIAVIITYYKKLKKNKLILYIEKLYRRRKCWLIKILIFLYYKISII